MNTGEHKVKELLDIFPNFRGKIHRNFAEGVFANLKIEMITTMSVAEILKKIPELWGEIEEDHKGAVSKERCVRFTTTPEYKVCRKKE